MSLFLHWPKFYEEELSEEELFLVNEEISFEMNK